MKPRLSSVARAQTQHLLRARLRAVPSATSSEAEASVKLEVKAAEFLAADRKLERMERAPAQQSAAEASAAEPSPVFLLQKAMQNWTASNLQKAMQNWTASNLAVFAALGRWLLSLRKTSGNGKRLRVLETISLGEKRFVAVLRVDGAQFLVGGGSDNLSLLASLQDAGPPSDFSLAIKQAEQNRELPR